MRSMPNSYKLDGFEYLTSIPKDDGDIIATVAHDDILFVASSKHIYKLTDERRLEKLGEI